MSDEKEIINGSDDISEETDTEKTTVFNDISRSELSEDSDSAGDVQDNQQRASQDNVSMNRPPRRKKKKKKRRSNRLPAILILVTLIFGISIISSLVIISFGKDMLGIGKSENTQVIVVPEGATTEQIALMLQEDGIIRSSDAFKIFADFRGEDLGYVVGEHFVRPNMPYETIIEELTKIPTEEMGESIQITFPEGITLIDAGNLLEENHICDADDFIFYFNSGGYGVSFEDLLPLDSSIKFQRMEGYLFPDTYFFYENSTPEEVCQKIYYNFDQKLDDERRARMSELNLSLDQLITFASLVQKEASRRAVMNDVASVFWNRLNNSDIFPLLQSDPTSNYSKDVIRPNMQYFDQTIVDAYDTYKSPGLPPGPICNPGLDAIDAVLTAKQTDYFYFIANINTKETYFAADLDEHEANQAMIEEQYAEAKNN
ncbi:MAG: endolytic transglycosylase MltG [Ruminococcus sp.]|nr:endolytic transglycosylase MltG [Ruminococcus sp.]